MKKNGLHPHSGKLRAEIKNNAGGASCESCRQQDGTISLWNPKDIEGRADRDEARHDRSVRSATRKPNRKRQLKFMCDYDSNVGSAWKKTPSDNSACRIKSCCSGRTSRRESRDRTILKDFDVCVRIRIRRSADWSFSSRSSAQKWMATWRCKSELLTVHLKMSTSRHFSIFKVLVFHRKGFLGNFLWRKMPCYPSVRFFVDLKWSMQKILTLRLRNWDRSQTFCSWTVYRHYWYKVKVTFLESTCFEILASM